MFARAAIVGRVARERSEARRQFMQQKQELRKKEPQAPLRQRCFIPILRGPCMTVGLGCFLILIGAIMCNFAFHAEKLSVVATYYRNETVTDVTEVVTNRSKYEALKSLTFIGPSLMGLGIFVIIIACVLLLDKRDKILKEYVDSIIQNQQDLSMELSFRAVRTTDFRPSEQIREKTSCTYSELDEMKVADSPDKAACSRLASSSPCFQTFREMEDIEEMPHGQDIELVTLNEQSQALQQPDVYKAKLASDEQPETDSPRQSLLAED